jgi:hypothetical protein
MEYGSLSVTGLGMHPSVGLYVIAPLFVKLAVDGDKLKVALWVSIVGLHFLGYQSEWVGVVLEVDFGSDFEVTGVGYGHLNFSSSL